MYVHTRNEGKYIIATFSPKSRQPVFFLLLLLSLYYIFLFISFLILYCPYTFWVNWTAPYFYFLILLRSLLNIVMWSTKRNKRKTNWTTVELKFYANRLNCSAIVMRYTHIMPSEYDKISHLKYMCIYRLHG